MIKSFFVPSVSKSSHARIHGTEWQTGIFITSETVTPYYVSKAAKEKAIVVGATGLNTLHLMNPNEVKELNDAGISVVWVALPKPKRGININDSAVTVVKEFFTSPTSPAHTLFPMPAPRFLATHSTSGRILLELLHDEQTAKKLKHHFSGAVYVAPYLDTANSSRMHNPRMDFIFRNFAQTYSDLTPHETLVGRTYMAVKASTEGFRLSAKHPNLPHEGLGQEKIHSSILRALKKFVASPKHDAEMTYGQILQLQDASRKLMDQFNPAAAAVIPSIFLIGDKDPFACHRTTEHFARQMGAEIVTANGAGHYPMKDAPDLLNHFIRRVDICVRERNSIKVVSPQEFWANQSRHEPAPAYADETDDAFLGGLSGALKGITGRLYPAARIFQ